MSFFSKWKFLSEKIYSCIGIGMTFMWPPFNIVSDNPDLYSRWLLLLKTEISSIVNCCFIINQNELKFYGMFWLRIDCHIYLWNALAQNGPSYWSMECFGSEWTVISIYGMFWLRMDHHIYLYGMFWLRIDCHIYLWNALAQNGPSYWSMECFGSEWTVISIYGMFWLRMDHHIYLWNVLAQNGPSYWSMECFGPELIVISIYGMFWLRMDCYIYVWNILAQNGWS